MMVFLVPIIAAILLIWAIDAVYFTEEPGIAQNPSQTNQKIMKKEELPQNYVDKYIKK